MLSAAQKTLNKLDKKENWRKTVLDMYDQGASDREIMRELRITPSNWDTLYEAVLDSDFKEFIDFGRMLAHAWWDTQGRIHLKTRGFSASIYGLVMKNRYGWSEKTEQATTNLEYKNMDDAALTKKIQELTKTFSIGRGKS